jgi:hypothetical protein
VVQGNTGDRAVTLGRSSRLTVAASAAFLLVALALFAGGLYVLVGDKHVKDGTYVGALVLFATGALVASIGWTSLRARVVVTPTTLTAYNFRGPRFKCSSPRMDIDFIEWRSFPGGWQKPALDCPYVGLRDGRGFQLQALGKPPGKVTDRQRADYARLLQIIDVPHRAPRRRTITKSPSDCP